MNIHDILNLALEAGNTAAIAALAKLLASSNVANAVQALGVKAAAETEKLLSEAAIQHNILLNTAVHAAMTYAENHQAEVLKEFDSKADYVIETIDADPRFAHLNLPLDTIKHLVEQLYSQYFAHLKSPQDVTGGGPGASAVKQDVTGGGPGAAPAP